MKQDNNISGKPDTGAMLRNFIAKHRIRKNALARVLERNINTLVSFQKNNTIQTAVLWDISVALKHNFFRDIADQLPAEFTIDAIPDNTAAERIAALELEVTILKAEKEVLIRAMRG